MTQKPLTVHDVSEITGWCKEKVRALIRSGRLKAANTSTGSRPTYTITPEALSRLIDPPSPKRPSRLKRAEQIF